MYYLIIGAAFCAVLFMVLFFKEHNARVNEQRELRVINSKLEDESRLHEKADKELSSIEQQLFDSEQNRVSLENRLRAIGRKVQDHKEENTSLHQELSRLRTVERKIQDLISENTDLHNELSRHEHNLENLLQSNLSSIPWLAGMMADYMTYDIEIEAKKLDWGSNIQREKKVASLRAIRTETKQRIEDAKIASYQLEYLLALYPGLSDVIETDFSDLHLTGEIPQHDPVRDWLSREEWNSLSEDARNQLALDRYIQSRSKSKWQIGRDYELSVAHELMEDGFSVENTGSYLRLEDMGRDIIAHKNGKTYILQCKYWSEQKVIHEKHIYQLYGTAISYTIESAMATSNIVPVFVTNICLSEVARKAASMLNVLVYENHPIKEFPRIKCNIGRDEYGQTKIYHLPMDAQYDNTMIKNPGEFYAYTVSEATQRGFRRAFKWHGE